MCLAQCLAHHNIRMMVTVYKNVSRVNRNMMSTTRVRYLVFHHNEIFINMLNPIMNNVRQNIKD